uniref:Uncharacterized protein n=1 Tax=Anguilla anguilla TaxID=7936 RepID=A0A0E9RMU8_ANGAN
MFQLQPKAKRLGTQKHGPDTEVCLRCCKRCY